jgi:hypothetical protein
VRLATWGAARKAYTGFMMAALEEYWLIGDSQFIERNGRNPSGFDLEAMNEALASLTRTSNPLNLRKIQ